MKPVSGLVLALCTVACAVLSVVACSLAWAALRWMGFALVLAVFVGGCGSSTEDIHKGANRVALLASEAKAELADATATGEVGPAATPHVEAASEKQDQIIGEAARVHTAAAGVTDKVWVGWAVLRLWGIVAAVLAIVGAAIYFGLGPIIRRITAWLGWFIPKADQEAAEMDLAAMRAHPESAPVRESIAAKRARKATYEAAMRKAKRRERERLIAGAKP